jgi:hypothetical protein
MKLPVCFLDIDGVLNSAASRQRTLRDGTSKAGFGILDPEAIARLNRLHAAVPCAYVISSTWRLMLSVGVLTERLRAQGFTGDVVGATPELNTIRGAEILAWVEKYDVKRFVILDDDDDMGPVAEHLVQTSFEVGLTDADVSKAVRMLAGAS